MTIHVFLGPSLPVDQARTLVQAEYHPPAQVGDIYELAIDRNLPTAIAIIDGRFEQVPAVWHKEILYLLSRGVRVFGAASMGALRAAELWPFGMEGVGEVFGLFRTGELEDDDEVAVSHADADYGYRPLSEAMVNVRAGLGAAVQQGIISPSVGLKLTSAVKTLFYPDRTWGAVYELAGACGLSAQNATELRSFIAERRPDSKKNDAIALLSNLAAMSADDFAQRDPAFVFEPTYNWEKLVRIVTNDRHARTLSSRLHVEVPDCHRVVETDHPGLTSEALLDFLACREADRLGLILSDGDRITDAPTAIGALLGRYHHELYGHVLERLMQRAFNSERAPDVPEQR
jgi:hypothetical protein